MLDQVRDYTRRIALGLRVKGLINLQMAEKDGKVYVLEANPRSSRTIPFVSKAVGIPLAKIAAKVIAGHSLKSLGYTDEPKPRHVSIKEVLLPFDKLPGADPVLGPEMKSTGEVMGIDYDFGRAYYKAELAADNLLPLTGKVFLSIRNADKPELVEVARKLQAAGLELMGTRGTVKSPCTARDLHGYRKEDTRRKPECHRHDAQGRSRPDNKHPHKQAVA